jgi:hypothetical protein
MGAQFIRIECFSRKPDKGGRTVGFVLGEARREPSASTHVENPGVPVVVFGKDPAEIEEDHNQAVEAARETNVAGKTRKIRVDQHTLLTAVASHPALVVDMKNDEKQIEVEAWIKNTVAWMQQKWGDDLRGVVLHLDEAHPHLHAFIIPENLRARELHPGVEAKKAEVARALGSGDDSKTANKRGDRAYKAAMRSFLDHYHQKVGLSAGLLRDGPKRARLSRGEYLAAKAAAKNLADLMAQNEEMRLKIERNSRRYKEVVGQMKERAAQWAAAAAVAKSKADSEQARVAALPQTVAGKLALAWRVGRQMMKKVNLSEQQKQAAERQSLVHRIKKAAVQAARKEVGGEVEALRAEAEAAKKRESVWERRAIKMEEKLGRVLEDNANLEESTKKLAREALAAEAAQKKAEAERETFRGLWAEAANSRTAQSLARR